MLFRVYFFVVTLIYDTSGLSGLLNHRPVAAALSVVVECLEYSNCFTDVCSFFLSFYSYRKHLAKSSTSEEQVNQDNYDAHLIEYFHTLRIWLIHVPPSCSGNFLCLTRY
jgi:hypothetical protein